MIAIPPEASVLRSFAWQRSRSRKLQKGKGGRLYARSVAVASTNFWRTLYSLPILPRSRTRSPHAGTCSNMTRRGGPFRSHSQPAWKNALAVADAACGSSRL